VNMVGVAVITGGIFALRFGLNRRMRERDQ
jgi:hypothetical protein